MNPSAQKIIDTVKGAEAKLAAIEFYEERAGIIEFEAKKTRVEAEAGAIEELKARLGIVTQKELF